MFYYTPGTKAVREFKSFNKNHVLKDVAAEDVIETEPSVAMPTPSDTGDVQARDLVTEFYSRFHNTKNSIPQPKELKQAAEFISEHGMEKARHFVRFSHQIASDTGYKPQVFGGILQYAGRAVDDFEKRQTNLKTNAATAQCTLCDRYGQVRMRDAKKMVVMMQCVHDVEIMKDRANSKGYTFDIRNRDVSNEA